MKSLFSILLSLLIFSSCGNEVKKSNNGIPGIKFSKTEFDFGTIQMGEKVTYDFVFENVGDGDLLITKVDSDCGCTVVNYKMESIAPGEKSSITAEFDSSGLPGFQLKKINVFSNAGEPVVLTVSAFVDYELN